MNYVGAYLVRGNENALESLVEKLTHEKVITKGSPDLFMRVYRKFGVDEAEEIRARARTRPVVMPQRVFVFFAPSLTSEAQNALLKTFEEPSANALFFLVTPSPETLLATVRSRVQFLELPAEGFRELVDTDDFLAASPDKRLQLLKPLYDYDEDEGRDMASVIGFLQALELKFAKIKRTPESDEGLRALYRARKYIGDKGSLLKSLLEQVALLTPKM